MKKGFPGFLAGLLCGGFLFGGSVAYAAGIVATPFSEMDQKLTLNGNPITLTGYNINGNNYFMLRDIGRAVGFSVAWNGSTRTVEIDTARPYEEEQPADSVAPTDGSRYVPQVGDTIRCPDGTDYTITDVSRWDKNAFVSGPLGELPQPTCDWSSFPEIELPAAEVRHFQLESGESLYPQSLRDAADAVHAPEPCRKSSGHQQGRKAGLWRQGQPSSQYQTFHSFGDQRIFLLALA